MIQRQRYLARYLGPKGNVPLFAIGCPGSGSGPAAFQSSVPRVLARFLGLADDFPLYGYSTCEFPRIGRYLMRFVGMAADGLPVYTLGCCLESSSGPSGSSGAGSTGSDSGGSLGSGSATGPSGSGSCPEYPWETQASGGASWSGDEDFCFNLIADLRKRWDGVLWHNPDPTPEEQGVDLPPLPVPPGRPRRAVNALGTSRESW
jgi:hypothetical protein